MIEVLRLSHRLRRDVRLSSHIGLTSRAFLVDKLYYSGDHDSSLEESISDIVSRFGGSFSISYVKNPVSFVKNKKKEGYLIVHLTVYGMGIKKKINKLKNKKILIVIGSEHVPPVYYELADYNVSITSQPISELSALTVFLHELLEGKELDSKFEDAKVKIVPSERGKKVSKN